MRVELLGVRGSTAAPGPDFVRYGGHTSCVAVTADGDLVPSLVLDAGTGLRTLTQRLAGRAFTGSILLSHLRWDHVQTVPVKAYRIITPEQYDALYAALPATSSGPEDHAVQATSTVSIRHDPGATRASALAPTCGLAATRK